MTGVDQEEIQRKLRILESMPGFGWSANSAGQFTYVTPNALDFLGVASEDLNNTGADDAFGWRQVVHPDDYDRVAAQWRHCLQTGDHYDAEHRLRRTDGSYRWFRNSGRPFRDEQGEILEWYGTTIDIDEQVRLRHDIAEREAKIRRLVDSDIIGIVIWDLDGTLIDANDAFLRMVQYDREDVEAGVRWFDMTPPEWQEIHGRVEAEELAATGKMQAREKEYFRKDGSRVPVLIGAACFEGQSRQGVAYILDLTEQKRAEQALLDRQRELSQLVDMIPSHLWRLTPDGAPAFFNKRLVDYLGREVGDVARFSRSGLAAFITAVIHPDDVAGVADAFGRSLASGANLSMKWRMRRADGAYRWMSASAEALRDADGAIVQWYVASVDIEDEMRAQAALREREQMLHQLVETLPAMIDCATPDGDPIYRSQQMADYLGFGFEEPGDPEKPWLNRLIEACVHPDDLAGVQKNFAHSLSSGDPYARRHRLRRSDGEYRWVETRAAPMRDVDGAIRQWNIICLDVDSEVRAQQELQLVQERLGRASQAAGLAELSASIAHEVNQPLTAIVANSQACHRWLAAEPPNIKRAKITAEHIVRNANAAAGIVSRIRAMFSQSTVTRTARLMGDLIAETCDLLADEAARRGVQLEFEVAREVPAVALDPIQIQQVLLNLIRNGMEAMDGSAKGRVLHLRAHRVGDVVQTEVRDNGPGIAMPARMFEPFFTTKEHGMGIGLAICRSIVESHGGRLWAENREPHGATFAFTLPIGGNSDGG